MTFKKGRENYNHSGEDKANSNYTNELYTDAISEEQIREIGKKVRILRQVLKSF